VKQISVISGKGGTGKTSLVAAFVRLAGRVVAVDTDVDAANLAIIIPGEDEPERGFTAGRRATVDETACTGCMECDEPCRPKAIIPSEECVSIDPLACDGCGVCDLVCPEDAISFVEHEAGKWTIRWTGFGPLVHARLGIAEDNSGKLVARLRDEALRLAGEEGIDLVLIDGPPGVGCPVHAAIGGVDLLVAVTEPTVSGRHDLDRALGLARHFELPAAVIVNKVGLHDEGVKAVEELSREYDAPILGRIPFSSDVPRALAALRDILEVDDVSNAVAACWTETRALLDDKED